MRAAKLRVEPCRDVAMAAVLKVGGLTPFSATDYPGQLAAVVFVQGCPWRCGYCHNPHLQSRTAANPLAWPQVMARLRQRVGLLDAVVFSGGEPTMDPGLEAAVREVRRLGFAVGLHTAGMYPRRLARILPLLDWVGMDIKAGTQGYDRVTGMTDSARHIVDSAQQVLASGLAYEFRTTVHPSLHTPQELLYLAHTLADLGVRHYVLQAFRGTGCADAQLRAAPVNAELGAALLAQVAALFDTFTLRRQ